MRRLVGARSRTATKVLFVALPAMFFLALGVSALTGEPYAWERQVLNRLHASATPALDNAALWWSRVFHPQVLVVVTVLLTLGFVLRRAWRQAAITFGIVVGALLLSTLVKEIVGRPRPALWPSLSGETNSGFPSGHAMTSLAFAATLLILSWPVRWRAATLAVAAIWVALTGLARLYLGVHYPTDVAAGWGLSLAWVASAWWVAETRRGGGKDRQ